MSLSRHLHQLERRRPARPEPTQPDGARLVLADPALCAFATGIIEHVSGAEGEPDPELLEALSALSLGDIACNVISACAEAV